MTYTYSIQNDFPNQKLDMGSFIEELKGSFIPVENLIVQNDDVVKIITSLELTSEQISTVETIISNHEGELIVETYTEKVKIVEEQVDNQTQGHFQATTIDLYISGVTGETYTDISFPYPVSLFSSEWLVAESQIGDSAEFQIAPNTICGVLRQEHSSGDTTLYVNDTVFTQANIMLGYYIKVNGQELGRVIAKDQNNLTITVENGLSTNLSAMTPVMFTVKVVPHWRFNAPGFCSVGESKIGASFIPANTTMRMVYHNNTGTAKWFAISLDYLY
jgi:hypothetical protein